MRIRCIFNWCYSVAVAMTMRVAVRVYAPMAMRVAMTMRVAVAVAA